MRCLKAGDKRGRLKALNLGSLWETWRWIKVRPQKGTKCET